jgi:hypothetical protein
MGFKEFVPMWNARRELGEALNAWRDSGAHPEKVVFAIEDLVEAMFPDPPETVPTAPEAHTEASSDQTPEGSPG